MKRILLVDDERLIAQSVEYLLRREGYSVVAVDSGQKALEEVKKQSFDLFIVDICMPGWNGVETIKRIRKYLHKENLPSVPEIMITGYADYDKYEQATRLAVSEYIHKPFDVTQILTAVRKGLKETSKT